VEQTAPQEGLPPRHGRQQEDPVVSQRTLEAGHFREAQANSAERDAEPRGPGDVHRSGPELDGEGAAGPEPAEAGQLEDEGVGDGPEGRPPRVPGEERQVVRVEPAVQEGPRGRLGPARRGEGREEQDLGRPLEGAHAGLTATKK